MVIRLFIVDTPKRPSAKQRDNSLIIRGNKELFEKISPVTSLTKNCTQNIISYKDLHSKDAEVLFEIY
jgi:hypothetical protein